MKLAFVGNLYPEEYVDDYRKLSKNGIDNAANVLQWSLIEGFRLYSDVQIYTLPAVGTYPIKSKRLFFKSTKIGSHLFCLGFVNFPIVSHLTKVITLYFSLRRNLLFDTECIVVYGMTSYFLLALFLLKKKYKKIKVCLIIPDLPQYMSGNRNVLYLLAKKIDKNLMYRLLRCVDGYVLISKFMTELLPSTNHWTVVEGIFDEKRNFTNEVICDNPQYKYIMYSGTLAKRYGVMNLVEAFQLLKNTEIFLVICGAGDTENDIIECAKKNPRIKFKGQLSREKVLELQRKAFLLVNPRLPNESYTKYSFPSKNIEYLASGTPTLFYKLEGIPDEYFKYSFSLTDLSIEALSQFMEEILSMNWRDLRAKGVKARNFIVKEKSPKRQVRKIIELIKTI